MSIQTASHVGGKQKVNLGAYGINTYAEYGIFWGEEVTNYPPEK